MKKQLTIISLFALILSSCIEEIDLKLDTAEFVKLVVESAITDQDEPQTVKLSLTSPYDSNEPSPPATGAVVLISVGENVYEMPEVSPGIYQSDEFTGIVGEEHTLSVWYENENYTASSQMRPSMVIDSIGFKRFPFGIPQDQPHWEILVYGQDDPEREEFHIFQYAINGEWQDTLIYAGFYAGWFTNGQYIDGETVAYYATYEETVEVKVRVVSIDEQYLWFVDSVIWAVMPDMFFSPPRANIKGNISNGAMGYFRASAVYETQSYVLNVYD